MSGTELSNQEKLEEVYKLTLENNTLLHGMRNRERIANAIRILYWLVIIGSLFGAYYYIRPVIDVFTTNKGKIDETLTQFQQLQQQLPEMKVLQQLLEKLKSSTSGQ
ncbi:MAG: hypothetical protein QG653_298 [Patescibacteria group bacterium]|nr:hypothetical protein [Patescibacteria group bacterium]